MTFGIKVGKALGATAAVAVTATKGGFAYTGQFGRDVVQGTKDGYDERMAKYAAARSAAAAQLRAKTEALPAPAPQTATAAA